MRNSISIQFPPDRKRRAALGQFLTPSPVADLMASFFEARCDELDLLDAGSGEGALSIAFVRSVLNKTQKPRRITITAYELDQTLIESLQTNLKGCERECDDVGIEFSFNVINADFVSVATDIIRGGLYASPSPQFNAAIVNPPYKKIRSDSSTRRLLRYAGIETSNLYAGFVGLISRLLAKGGELVAITPRSYCNGPYFKPFRSEFLEMMSLRRLHVFESRSAAFRDDKVLQENVIVHAVRGNPKPSSVVISVSSGKSDGVSKERVVPYDQVVLPGDEEQFIYLPTDHFHFNAGIALGNLKHSLHDLDLSVSTGKVVDFRARSFLRQKPGSDTAPLIYPSHFNGGVVRWPGDQKRKPNAIEINESTRELLIPAGIHVLVKRFSAKEERRRIVACIYDPERIPSTLVGFENHLNYFHCSGSGLRMNLAKGLAAFLNSTVVDRYFRQFSGHTQVNATDLRKLPYPGRGALEDIGDSLRGAELTQAELDNLVEGNLV